MEKESLTNMYIAKRSSTTGRQGRKERKGKERKTKGKERSRLEKERKQIEREREKKKCGRR